jgi:hypothetical protein
VYRDTVAHGQWYWCSRCRFAGDAIELTAAHGGLSVDTAVEKLRLRGFAFPATLLTDERMERHAEKYARRAALRAFWERCRLGIGDVGRPLGAQRKLGIPADAWSRAEWRARAGRFIGRANREAIEEFFLSRTLAYRRSVNRRTVSPTSWGALFPSRDWDDLIVIAYHDLPDRIRGLLLIGREGRDGEDHIYQSASPRLSYQAGGFAMLETGLTPHPEFGETVFSVEDPTLALRLQVKHLAASDTPLPLIIPWPKQRPHHPEWACFPHRTLVFWSPGPTPAAIDRARRNNGSVAFEPDQSALAGHLERARPVVALRAMRDAARGWADALERMLTDIPPARAEELVLGLKLPAPDVSNFLRGCGQDTRARLGALFADAGKPQGVQVGRSTVLEVSGEWKVPKTGELVMDAVLRIERVVRTPGGRAAYAGYVEYHGQRIPFYESAEVVNKGTMDWIRRLVADRRLGEVLGTPRWSKHLVTIATQLEPPRTVEGLESVGWDEGRNAFVLPQFVLRPGGDVEPAEHILIPGEDPPAAELEPPIGLTPGARTALAWGDEATELFWAVAACLVADVIAPALGLSRTSTALVGEGAWVVGLATALACGCREVEVPDRFKLIPRHARRRLEQHRWPTIARRSAHDPRREVVGRLAAELPTGVVVPLECWSAASLHLRGGWNVVRSKTPALSTTRIVAHGSDVLRNYLKDLCVRRLALEPGTCLVDAVHRDLAGWYTTQAAARPAWRLSRLEAADPSRLARDFGRLLARMLADGELRYLTGRGARKALTLLEGGHVHVPKRVVSDVLEEHGAPPLDVDAITRAIDAEGVLLEECDFVHVAGWVLPERWLRQHQSDYDCGLSATS